MKKKTLGEVSNIITGPFGSQLHKKDYVDHGIPVVMPQNIGNRTVNFEGITRITRKDFERLHRYATQKNDILFARRGDVEKHAFISFEDEAMCGTGCFRVRVTEQDVHPLYLSLYLNRVETRRWLTMHAIGSNMPNLNTGILSEVPIEYPDYNVQVRIASFLQQIDDKIAINKNINDNLQQMASMTYMHYFFKKTPNGTIGDIIVENPKSPVQVGDAKASVGGNIPFFTSGDAILKWNSPMIDGRNSYLNTGGNADVKFYVGKAAYSTDTWCISAKKSLSDYLFLLLLSIKPELNQKFFQGTGLKHLQKPLLKDRAIYVPSDEETSAFNKMVKPWFDIIASNINESQSLIALRDWLLPMLMNGQATIADCCKLSFIKKWLY